MIEDVVAVQIETMLVIKNCNFDLRFLLWIIKDVVAVQFVTMLIINYCNFDLRFQLWINEDVVAVQFETMLVIDHYLLHWLKTLDENVVHRAKGLKKKGRCDILYLNKPLFFCKKMPQFLFLSKISYESDNIRVYPVVVEQNDNFHLTLSRE